MFKHTPRTHTGVANEVDLYEKISQHVSKSRYKANVLTLKEIVWPQSGRGFQPGTQLDEVHMFVAPLAQFDLELAIVNHRSGMPKLSASQLAGLFREVAQGLSALHTAGWIHRDIKTANLGVVSLNRPRACVLDLEFAININDEADGRGEVRRLGVGTLGWRAPELERVGNKYDYAVDIWALGCVGVNMFFGLHPWFDIYSPWNQKDVMTDPVRCHKLLLAYHTWSHETRQSQGPWNDLLLRMLEEKPAKRPIIEDVLNDEQMLRSASVTKRSADEMES